MKQNIDVEDERRIDEKLAALRRQIELSQKWEDALQMVYMAMTGKRWRR